jgi:hypothetical protein
LRLRKCVLGGGGRVVVVLLILYVNRQRGVLWCGAVLCRAMAALGFDQPAMLQLA